MTKQLTFGNAREPVKPPSSRYLTLKDLPGKGVQYHVNHLRRMWNSGQFPAPIHLSPRKLAWPESAIDAWLASKSERSARAPTPLPGGR